jgi:hypothetical protein
VHTTANPTAVPLEWGRVWAEQYRRPRWPQRLRPWLTWRSLFVTLLVIHILPIWIITYFPTQDGPAHIYNASILVDGFDPANFQIRQVYTWNYGLHPNILTHVMLAGFLQVFPPLVAEKVLVSMLIALVPLSMLYMLRGFERGAEIFSLAGFLIASHNLLHMGFYNFSMSLPLALFAFGWWWRHRDSMTPATIGVFYLLAWLTYTAHFAGFTALVLAIFVTAGWAMLLRFATAFWKWLRNRTEAPLRPAIVHHLRYGIIFLGYMLPAAALAWDYNFRTHSPERVGFSPDHVQAIFWDTLVLVSFTDWHEVLIPFGKPRDINTVLWITAVMGVLTVLYRLGRRQWLQERDGILITCAILAWLFFNLPRERNVGGWVNDRIFLLGFTFLWTWFSRFHHPLNVLVGSLLVLLSLLHTGRLTYDYILLQPELREMTAAVHLIEPHSTLRMEIANADRAAALPHRTLHVSPFLHVHSYYGLGRDIALFDNYEAGHTYFFTGWGETRREAPDYILIWGHPPQHARRHQESYEIIHQSNQLHLLRIRQNEPDLQHWAELEDGRRVLRLRMAAARGGHASEAGIVSMPREHQFDSGSYGWVRNAPRREWQPGGGGYGTPVGDNRDRALRVDLPNGRYRVTCYFLSHPQGDYQVNLIANRERVIRARRIEQADGVVAMQYEIEVRDGRLIQVFYTTWKRSADRTRLNMWAVSGVDIEQLDPPVPAEPSD